MTAPDGLLFEYFDDEMNSTGTVSITEYVNSWTQGVPYGARQVCL
jgi:hypothetical protein